jgi:hypothetical protein
MGGEPSLEHLDEASSPRSRTLPTPESPNPSMAIWDTFMGLRDSGTQGLRDSGTQGIRG